MSTDPMQVFKEAIDKARLEGYEYAIKEMIKFLDNKSTNEIVQFVKESEGRYVREQVTDPAYPIDEFPEGEPDPKDFIAPPPPKVGKGYCPKCLALKTHCVCNGVGYDCECGECACMKPVRQEGQVCKSCQNGSHQE